MCFSFSRERGSSRYAPSFLSSFGFPSRFETPFPPSFVPASLTLFHCRLSLSLSSWLNNIIDIILHDVERPKEDDANERRRNSSTLFLAASGSVATWRHTSASVARQGSIHIKKFVLSIRVCALQRDHFEVSSHNSWTG